MSYPESWTTYTVNGDTLADVAESISHLPEAGECRWNPTFSYQAGEDGLVTSATVECPFTIQTPVWAERDQASNAAKAEWDRWLGALADHERGHVTAVTPCFSALAQQMVGHGGNDVQALFDAACTAAQAASDAFDAQTNHGLLAGTVMDTSIA